MFFSNFVNILLTVHIRYDQKWAIYVRFFELLLQVVFKVGRGDVNEELQGERFHGIYSVGTLWLILNCRIIVKTGHRFEAIFIE